MAHSYVNEQHNSSIGKVNGAATVIIPLDYSYFVEKENVSLLPAAPNILDKPIIKSNAPHKNWQPWISVIKPSDESNEYKLFFNALNDISDPSRQSVIAYETSADLRTWSKDGKTTSLDKINFGARVFQIQDEENSRKYKYGILYFLKPEASPVGKGGIYLAFSNNLTSWKIASENPIFPSNINDIVDIYWNEEQQEYTAFLKQLQKYKWKNKQNQSLNQTIRLVATSTSNNLLKWTKIQTLFAPDEKDDGVTQWYGTSSIRKVGDYHIGYLKVVRDDLNITKNPNFYGIGFTVLIWSRNGKDWVRDRQNRPFLHPYDEPNLWHRTHTWVDAEIIKDDERWLFFGGYGSGHKGQKETSRQIGVATQNLFRYKFITPKRGSKKAGRIVTKPVDLISQKIFVDAENLSLVDIDKKLDQLLQVSAINTKSGLKNKCSLIQAKKSIYQIACKPLRQSSLYSSPHHLEFLIPKNSRIYSIQIKPKNPTT